MCPKMYIAMNIPVYYDPSIGTRGQGYNLGDILNMPVFWDNWKPFRSRRDLSVVASQLPQSIAGLYYNCRSNGLGDVNDDPLIPHRPRLLYAVNESIAMKPEIQPVLQMVQNKSVLCVHVRSGDYGPVTDDFLHTIVNLSKQFSKIIVLSGVHCNGNKQVIDQNKANLNQCLDKIRTLVPDAVFDFNEPDVHVCYMSRARNLLVHTGGFSILGSLVFSGKNLYVTSAFQPLKKRRNNELWANLQIPHQVINEMLTAPAPKAPAPAPAPKAPAPAPAPAPKAPAPIMKSAMPMMQTIPRFATKGISSIIPPRNKFSKNIIGMQYSTVN